MSSQDVTFQYMSDFQCLGSECEDHCCTTWTINLSKSDHERMERAMSKSPDHRDLFKISVTTNAPETRTDSRYSTINKTQANNCSFLAEDQLCKIHGDIGEFALGDVCSTFPRRLMDVGGVRELTGQLACPEIARRALLDPQGANLIALTDDMVTREQPAEVISADSERLICRHYDDIRTVFVNLFVDLRWDIEQRLFLMAYFGQRLSRFMTNDTGIDQLEALANEVDFILRDAVRDELIDQLETIPPSSAIGLALATWLLRSGSTNGHVKVFDNLGTSISTTLVDDQGAPLEGEELVSRYMANKAAIETKAPERISQILNHYVLHHLGNVPLMRAPDPLRYIQQMLLKMAVHKLLLFNHPDVLGALNESDEAFRTVLDATAVRVYYATARAVEHSGLLPALEASIASEHGELFATTVILARL